MKIQIACSFLMCRIFWIIGLSLAMCIVSCQEKPNAETEENAAFNIENPTNDVGLSKDLEFIPLNPARGDKAPQAGAVYGNIREDVATGYIGKFKDGFSSPPHIHNITYRAIVISGELHNDDESAPEVWMPAGSIWTQPKGQSHITSAKGQNAMAYIEIDEGPYLVMPVSESFDSGEEPLKLVASNVIYLGRTESKQIGSNSVAKIAYAWKKDNGEVGYLLKLPAGFKGKIHSEGSIFYGIVIKGLVSYVMPNSDEQISLDRASHFKSVSKAIHSISVNEESLVYIRTNDEFVVE